MEYNISILIPICNNGIECLYDSLSSVICQTYENWELIIGTNQNNYVSKTEQMVSMLDPDKNYDIKIIFYDDNEKHNVMNSMVKDTKYDHIAILDVEDIWLPEKLEKQIPYLEKYDVVGTKGEYFGDIRGFPNVPVCNITDHNFFKLNPIINSSVIIRKVDANWRDFILDYDMWFRLKLDNKKFYNVNTILCKHRVHKETAFNNKTDNIVEELRNKWKEIYKNHSNIFPK